jgi:L-alanine-DL-glutamate epimerase-like enolase superfamily enzyme
MAIWQELVDTCGFAAEYKSVNRFARKLRGSQSPEAEAGYLAVKFQLVYQQAYSDVDIVRLMRLARRIVGDQTILMLDVGYRWSDSKSAIWTLRQLEESNLYFVETPMRVDDLEGYGELAEAVSTRVAAGESLATRWEFQELMDRGKADVVQPDIARAGGLSESLRIAKQAHERGLLCIPHGWKSGITVAAQIHLSAASSNTPLIEYMEPSLWPSVIRSEVVRPEYAPKVGVIELPSSPGLGVKLNEEIIERLAVT